MLLQEQLKERLHYCELTGDFTWLKPMSNRVKKGAKAGHTNRGYRIIGVGGVEYPAHCLAVLYVTGKYPTQDVDHKNGTTHDNRYCNLREATRSQNLLNSVKRTTNTSGHKNVWFNKQRNTWQADCTIKGIYNYLGNFKIKDEAVAAYTAFARSYHGEFYKENT